LARCPQHAFGYTGDSKAPIAALRRKRRWRQRSEGRIDDHPAGDEGHTARLREFSGDM
jgi:hypothetical protein